jgi:hypothetical protein
MYTKIISSKSFQKFCRILVPSQIPTKKFDYEIGTQGPSNDQKVHNFGIPNVHELVIIFHGNCV